MYHGDDFRRVERRLDRIEQGLDHLHEMAHAVADAVAALGLSAGDQAALRKAGQRLAHRRKKLQDALDAFVESETTETTVAPQRGVRTMPSPVVDQVLAQVTATSTVIDSAVVLINGFHDMLTKAVSEALANGATAAELAPVSDALAVIKGKTDALAAAVAANVTS